MRYDHQEKEKEKEKHRHKIMVGRPNQKETNVITRERRERQTIDTGKEGKRE